MSTINNILFLSLLSHCQYVITLTVSNITGGLIVRTGYIIGGERASIEEFPFVVSLQKSGQHFCGGTILNPRWILTAAHCVRAATVRGRRCIIKIVAGVSEHKEIEQERRARRCFPHRSYSELTSHNDIALVRLRKGLELSEVIQPVTLAKRREDDLTMYYDECVAVGWGMTSADPTAEPIPSDFLLSARLPLVSLEKCNRIWTQGNSLFIKNTQLCTLDTKRDIGRGDSGGPLMCGIRGDYVQQGIMSFIGLSQEPSVYTRVDQYHRWIRRTIDGSGSSSVALDSFLMLTPCFILISR